MVVISDIRVWHIPAFSTNRETYFLSAGMKMKLLPLPVAFGQIYVRSNRNDILDFMPKNESFKVASWCKLYDFVGRV